MHRPTVVTLLEQEHLGCSPGESPDQEAGR